MQARTHDLVIRLYAACGGSDDDADTLTTNARNMS